MRVKANPGRLGNPPVPFAFWPPRSSSEARISHDDRPRAIDAPVGLALSPCGPVAKWLRPTAHNGLIAGSNPAGPTTHLSNSAIPAVPAFCAGDSRLARRVLRGNRCRRRAVHGWRACLDADWRAMDVAVARTRPDDCVFATHPVASGAIRVADRGTRDGCHGMPAIARRPGGRRDPLLPQSGSGQVTRSWR